VQLGEPDVGFQAVPDHRAPLRRFADRFDRRFRHMLLVPGNNTARSNVVRRACCGTLSNWVAN